jgi:AcrR family transcriptional regulator
MDPAAPPQRRRPPASLLERNRERILEAAVDVAAEAGWAGMTITAVARSAGLSPRPVQDRFPDRWALAAGAWLQVLGPALESALGELLAAAGLAPPAALVARSSPTPARATPPYLRERLESALNAAGLLGEARRGVPAAGEDPVHEMGLALRAALDAASRADHLAIREAGPSPEWMTLAYEPFLRPGPLLRSATEFLVVSEFSAILASAVSQWAESCVTAWCTPESATARDPRHARDPRDAARRAYLISTALGMLLAHTRQGVTALDLLGESRLLMTALTTDSQPTVLPGTRAEHLEDFLSFNTGDVVLDALLRATMEEVGRFGYDGATTAGIGRASGYNESSIFTRYGSKVDLFVDATLGQHARNWRANEAFTQAVTEAHGPGIAEAVIIREFQRPELRTYRAISLEQVRMALHDETLRQAQWGELDALVAEAQANDPNWQPAVTPAHLHMSVAIGLGVTVLPILAPDAWKLPYDVVTIPLNEP